MTDYEEVFAEHKPFLWGYCYRLTGTTQDADDTVQETFVRAMQSPPHDTTRPWRPWLVRVATNLARDGFRAARRDYTGVWLPAPISTDGEPSTGATPWSAGLESDVVGRYESLESVSFAFLLALEALSPRQRAVLLLRDVYDYSGRECAEALGLSIANVKTTLHRARRALDDYDENRHPPTPDLALRHKAALEELLGCFGTRDVAAMERLLAAEVEATSDANGHFHAAKIPVIGRAKVALFFSRIVPDSEHLRWRYCAVNGLPAVLVERPEAAAGLAPRFLFRLELDANNLITSTQAVLAPEKLTAISGARFLTDASA